MFIRYDKIAKSFQSQNLENKIEFKGESESKLSKIIKLKANK